MKHTTTTVEIHSISPEDLELHQEALATPKMNSENYEALKRDIEMNGQVDPVSVYRGKIVDGRHRWLILQELGVDTITYTKLPNNTTLAEIKQLVQSKEMRRHESAAQLAIRAYRLKVDPKSPYKSFVESADAVGANRKRVGEVKKIIETYGRNDIVEWLFAGDKFNTGTERIPFWTDSLGTILNWLAEHGTVVGATAKSNGIEPRKELTEDEQLLVNSYIRTLIKESDLVLEHITSELYSRLKGRD
jgi:hypothetical protein